MRGDVKVHPLTDFPERFNPGAQVWIKGLPVRIERSRWQGKIVVLKLEGIDDRAAVEAVRNEELLLPEAAELDPEEGVFYQHDVLGITAVDLEGNELGTVADIFSTGATDVYVITGERGELLVPAVEDVVHSIDISNKKMTIELMEGLEFQGGPKAKKPSTRRRRAAMAAAPEEPTAPDE